MLHWDQPAKLIYQAIVSSKYHHLVHSIDLSGNKHLGALLFRSRCWNRSMGPAHDNKPSPAIESWGVCASPDRATWPVNGKSPFSPHREAAHSFLSPALKWRKGKQCGFVVWLQDWAIRTSLLGSATDFSRGLRTVCLRFSSDKIESRTRYFLPHKQYIQALKDF